MSTKNLWAPWRLDYLLNEVDRPAEAGGGRCFLCDAADPARTADELETRLVLHRTEHGLLLLNRYPYTNGHLLVAPREHVGDLLDLDDAGRTGVMDLIALAARALKRGVGPQGYNVGFNVGRCAGAALPGHVHAHLVPRWHGDTNFMDVMGGVRVIPQALESSFAALRDAVAAELAAG